MQKKKHKYQGNLEKIKSGNGFVRTEEFDIFIDRDDMNGAMHGDEVQVDLIPEDYWDKNPRGIVARVLTKNRPELIGTYSRAGRMDFVTPVDSRNHEVIYVHRKYGHKARTGDYVSVEITRPPMGGKHAEGKVTEIVARKKALGSRITALIRAAGLTEEFPYNVSKMAGRIAALPVSEELIEGRVDLRNRITFTIDGADSKDLDDAVSIEKNDAGNYILGVHIADVSEYVRMNTPLDQEALKRGNSVYLLTRVIPMLPKSISNGICSLFAGTDRLTLSCSMEITPEGEIVDHKIYESVINSCERLVYDDVSDILENDDSELKERYAHILPELQMMHDLAKVMMARRHQAGSLDFDLDETHIELDANEVPVSVSIAERRIANRMIEEFMLAANQTVAEHYYWMEVPFVYRVHEKPDPEKMTDLRSFLANFNLKIRGSVENIHPKALNDVLDKVADTPEADLLSKVIVRSMQKAYYSPSCLGHFGLSFKYYTHFTSPIRRYPDLMIHRIIKSDLRGELTAELLAEYAGMVEQVSEISSKTEKEAMELERDVEKIKKAEFMTQHVGEIHDGIISGATGSGFFVQLPNTIEGMIPLRTLNDDYYVFDAKNYRVIGERTHKVYAMGDPIRIKVMNADPEQRIIDFAPVVPRKKKRR